MTRIPGMRRTIIAFTAGLTFGGLVSIPLVGLAQSPFLPPKKFPVFTIPLGDAGTEWTDFELKGSTNNFDSTGGAGSDVVYFIKSTDTNEWFDDIQAKVFVTDSGATDPREWILVENDATIASQLTDANSVVRYALVFASTQTWSQGAWVASDTWQFPGNTNLIWSYIRIDAVGEEVDAAAREVWNPIVPTEWRGIQPNRYDGGD